MKNCIVLFCLLIGMQLNAQNCSDLFISEYVEGFSNNKAIEIYNPTSQPIDLSQYMIIRYSNGSNTATSTNAIQLIGTIQPFDVHVGVLEKLDPLGTGQETPVDLALQNVADEFYCPNFSINNAFYFNGNDALVLAKGNLSMLSPSANVNTAPGFQIVDIFGKVGENPANEMGVSSGQDGAWSTVFPHNTGLGVLVTKDHSLIRKNAVLNGVTNLFIPSFNPLGEYDSLPPTIVVNGNTVGNWSTLGSHICDCECMPTYNTLNINQCTSYTSPSGVIYTASGNYLDVLTNSVGCDSLITINFTYTPQYDTLIVSACQSYSIGNNTFTNTGVFDIVNTGNCDTLAHLILSIVDTNSINVDICAVGIDNAGNNRVVWEKPLVSNLDYFNIYKETNQSGIYSLIGTRIYSDSSYFIDLNSNPTVQAYRYKIGSVDTCGLESTLSSEHKTIHLTINQGIGQSYNLIWSHYEGFNFSSYSIYRGNNPNNLSLLTTIANNLNSYTDLNAPSGQVYYQIVAENPSGCNPSKVLGYSSSRSNFADSETLGLEENEIQVLPYPNPVDEILSIKLDKIFIGSTLSIFDKVGRKILSQKIDNAKLSIDLSMVSSGVYSLHIEGTSNIFSISKQ